MNTELLNQFLSEDGDAHTRQMLLDAIRKQRANGKPLVWEYNFNRFDVIIDYEAKTVSLQDTLNMGLEVERNSTLDEFEKALQEAK